MTAICLIIGDPVSHSLSPRMHNAAYRAVGLESSFVYGSARVTSAQLPDAMAAIRTLGVRGVSVTMPHKEAVMAYLDSIDPTAAQLGAVNTIVNERGVLTGYNTDCYGIAKPLAQAIGGDSCEGCGDAPSTEPLNALVLGAGGAARAAAFALRSLNIPFSVTARTDERARDVAIRFGGSTLSWDVRDTAQAKIVINTTPIGMQSKEATAVATDDGQSPPQSPLPHRRWLPSNIAFETIYTPAETPFIVAARAGGASVILGGQMLLWQGVRQFELFTEREAPIESMRDSVEKR